MILRAVTLSLGLAGAFGAAQFPAYSQQYLQRLGGAVDALGEVVRDFDTSAAALGLSRADALEQMTGSAFVTSRRADMERTFARHAALAADLAVLEDLGPFMRAWNAPRMTDPQIASRAFKAFRPALPLELATLIFAGAGFAATWIALWFCRMLIVPSRRRRPMTA